MDRIDSITAISSLAAYSEASSSSEDEKDENQQPPKFDQESKSPVEIAVEADKVVEKDVSPQQTEEPRRTSIEIGGEISDEDDLDGGSRPGSTESQHRSASPSSPRYRRSSPSVSPVPRSSTTALPARPQSLVANYALDEGEAGGSDSDEDSSATGTLGSDNVTETDTWNIGQVEATSLSHSVQHMQEEDIQIPAEPPGQCSVKLQDKILELEQRVQRYGYDLNAEIQQRKLFRNPSIYEKLIEHIEIDEMGTNFPREIYDPSIWGPESFYDHLAKIQREEMDKREKEKKERTKIEFKSGTKKSDADNRRTKWDQSGGAGRQPSASGTSSTNISAVPVSSSASGNKTTVISAVGPIKRQKLDK